MISALVDLVTTLPSKIAQYAFAKKLRSLDQIRSSLQIAKDCFISYTDQQILDILTSKNPNVPFSEIQAMMKNSNDTMEFQVPKQLGVWTFELIYDAFKLKNLFTDEEMVTLFIISYIRKRNCFTF